MNLVDGKDTVYISPFVYLTVSGAGDGVRRGLVSSIEDSFAMCLNAFMPYGSNPGKRKVCNGWSQIACTSMFL